MRTYRRHLVATTALALLLAACGGGDETAEGPTSTETPTSTATTEAEDTATDGDMATDDDMDMDEGTEGDMDDMDMDMSGDYGEPAEASDADRTIEVSVDNEFAFDPDQFEVAEGEVVTFEITNSGDIEHEFVLGDEEAQQEMEEAMAEGDGHEHSGDMSNAVTIHAGETAELTWRFTTAGEVLVGCHVPGHYDGGMQGTVTVG